MRMPHTARIYIFWRWRSLPRPGVATYKFIPGLGTHYYRAVFAGTHTNAGSASAVSALTVTSTSPAGVSSAILSASSSGPLVLTATVTGNGSAAPTGTVSFLDTTNADYVLGTANLQVGATGLTLKQKSAPVTGPYPESIATADFNGDGIPDLAVANSFGNPSLPGTLTILLGKGDGTFTTSSTTATNSLPGSILASDFNSDGKIDLAYTDGDGVLNMLLGKGDGTFTPFYVETLGFGNFIAAVGDVNGDGVPDLIEIVGFSNSISVLLGKGDGTFTPTAWIPVGKNPVTVGVGDLNGDGKLDLFVENAFPSNYSLTTPVPQTVLLGNGDGTFTTAASPSGGLNPEGLVMADFNGDGNLDAAIVNIEPPQTVTVLLGKGDGTFGAPITSGTLGYLTGIAVGDFNGDGKPDLAAFLQDVPPALTQNIVALLGNGDGTFPTSAGAVDTGSGGPVYGVVADFNGDGLPDIAAIDEGANAAVFLTRWTGSSTAIDTAIAPIGISPLNHPVVASWEGNADYAGTTSSSVLVEG